MSKRLFVAVIVTWLAAAAASMACADEETVNYDEAKVNAYVLPDALVMSDGSAVTNATMWKDRRRPEILELFRSQVYGRPLPKADALRFHASLDTPESIKDKAIRKRVRIEIPGATSSWSGVKLTLILPAKANSPVGAFVGMHLFDSSSDEPVPCKPLTDDVGETLPGSKLLDVILKRGYAIGTLDAQDFCPDDSQQYREGALAYFFPQRSGPPGPAEPGAIAVWAWGLSRALDYLETDHAIDARRVAVIGHSRMGKTALWAGAQDERFALVISNNSGCGGAALSRRNFGETVSAITRRFPHWFCENFTRYASHEDRLPVDQHELIGLIAPRPVYVASAVEDRWADPRGEFLAAAGADPIYRLLGMAGLQTADMSPLGKSIGDSIGYHIRTGKHALTDYDWLRYLDFADRHFRRAPSTNTP